MPGKYEIFSKCSSNIRKCISRCFFPIDYVADITFRIIIPLILTTFYHIVLDFANMGIWNNMLFFLQCLWNSDLTHTPHLYFLFQGGSITWWCFVQLEFLVLPWISYASCCVCVCFMFQIAFLINYVPAGQYTELPI